jgi:hypothetical protein
MTHQRAPGCENVILSSFTSSVQASNPSSMNAALSIGGAKYLPSTGLEASTYTPQMGIFKDPPADEDPETFQKRTQAQAEKHKIDLDRRLYQQLEYVMEEQLEIKREMQQMDGTFKIRSGFLRSLQDDEEASSHSPRRRG